MLNPKIGLDKIAFFASQAICVTVSYKHKYYICVSK